MEKMSVTGRQVIVTYPPNTIYLCPHSTWIQSRAICCVCTTSSDGICAAAPRNGRMFKDTPRGKMSLVMKPLSAVTHQGVARMKAMARSHVWWPGMDDDIEETARRCQ